MFVQSTGGGVGGGVDINYEKHKNYRIVHLRSSIEIKQVKRYHQRTTKPDMPVYI